MKVRRSARCLAGILSFLVAIPALAAYQPRIEERVEALEQEISQLRDPALIAVDGAVVFLFGAFCALWAQRTKRNAWLWFFLGLFFNGITVLVLLYKNSKDQRAFVQPEPKGGKEA